MPEEATDSGMLRVTAVGTSTLIDQTDGAFVVIAPDPDAIIKTPYFVTYDPAPGPYRVNATGNINDNIADVLTLNVVQFIPNNSAGLQLVEPDLGAPKRAEPLPNLVFYLVLSSDSVTPATSKSPTVEVQRDDGSFAVSTNSAVEIGKGFYRINLTAAEMDGRTVNIAFTAPDCNQAATTILTAA